MTKRRFRPPRHIDAEHFHQLIVDTLSEAAHGDRDARIEIALERHLEVTSLFRPEHAIGRERRERALRRQPDSGHRRREFFGTGHHRALRGERFYADAVHWQRDGEARAPQSRAVEIVVARVTRSVSNDQARRNGPLIEAVNGAGVARVVPDGRQRRRVAAVVLLRAVRQAKVVGVRARAD